MRLPVAQLLPWKKVSTHSLFWKALSTQTQSKSRSDSVVHPPTLCSLLLLVPTFKQFLHCSVPYFAWAFFFLFKNILKYILLIMLLQLSHFPPPLFPQPCTPPITCIPPPPFTSCSWVVHIRSLASTFPILFLTAPCLFSTYHLCYLFSVPFPPFSPSHLP